MEKEYTNTLSRWHKIAERVRVAAQEVQIEITQALNAGTNIDFDTFRVRKDTLLANAEKALNEKELQCRKLQAALFLIRKELAGANVRSGVASLLNQIEQTKQAVTFYTNLINNNANALTVKQFEDLELARKLQPVAPAQDTGVLGRINSNLKVSFIRPDKMEELIKMRDDLRIKQNGLADQLAEANATKLTLVIDDDVAKQIGLQ